MAAKDLLEELRLLTKKAVCGREFVLIESLKKWLLHETQPGTGMTRVYIILRETFGQQRFPFKEEDVTKDRLLLFSLLVHLGHPQLINHFKLHGISDSDLAKPTANRENIQKYISPSITDTDSRSQKFAERFDYARWRFCPAILKDTERHIIDEEIVPFMKKTVINNKGSGYAKIWAVTVPVELVEDSFGHQVKHSEVLDDNLPCYKLVLKTFGQQEIEWYNLEKEMYENFPPDIGMVKYLGAYRETVKGRHLNGDPVNATAQPSTIQSALSAQITEPRHNYSLVLEYGDMDLEQFFLDTPPPVEAEGRVYMWEKLFQLVKTIDSIHNYKEIRPDEVVTLHGWHADIKPENILVVSSDTPDGWRFKLADPGFARHKREEAKPANDESGHRSDPTIEIKGGTRAYGAPERRNQRWHTQSIDIWSLGCVFSLAATWMLLGPRGFLKYRAVKIVAVVDLWKKNGEYEEGSKESHRDEDRVPDDREAFHDGAKLLQVVVDWHSYLRTLISPSDQITGLLLDIIEKNMLLKVPGERIKPGKLDNELTVAIDKARASLTLGIPTELARHLAQIEKIDTLPKAKELIGSALHQAGDPWLDILSKTTATLLVQPNAPSSNERRKSKVISSLRSTRSGANNPNLTFKHSGLSPQTLPSELHNLSAIQEDSGPPVGKIDSPSAAIPGLISIDTRNQVQERESIATLSSQGVQPSTVVSRTSLQHESSPVSREEDVKLPPKTVDHIKYERERRERKQGKFKRAMNHIKSVTQPAEEPDHILQGKFVDRDIRILIDNGATMQPYWHLVQSVTYELAAKAVNLDENGFDLHTTNGRLTLKKQRYRHLADLKKNLDKHGPMERPASTDMIDALGKIFHNKRLEADRIAKLPGSEGAFKMEVLYVLTDGAWEWTDSVTAVGQLIVNFWESIREHYGKDRQRPYSIQFIQFGHLAKATRNLKWLDDDLHTIGATYDIVDTTHHSSNFYKMMLGSFTPRLDWSQNNDQVNIDEQSPRSSLSLPRESFAGPSRTSLHDEHEQRLNSAQSHRSSAAFNFRLDPASRRGTDRTITQYPP